jgi:hypothetical protein
MIAILLLLFSGFGFLTLVTSSSRHGFYATVVALGVLGFFALLRILLENMSNEQKNIMFTVIMLSMTVMAQTYIKRIIDSW